MRKIPFVNNHYYHIYNRGVEKRDIFQNRKDIERFLLSMELFSFEEPVRSIQVISRDNFVDVGRLQKGKKLVSIVEYCLNPNHFHFILKQEVDGGVSEFMKRLSGGYTKYFNEKYQRSGILFQGKFKSSYIEDENYFRILIAYVMWNYKIHNIPKNKIILVASSEEEYRNQKFKIVNQKEGERTLDIFGGYKKLLKYANETITMIRKKRGKEAFEYDDDL